MVRPALSSCCMPPSLPSCYMCPFRPSLSSRSKPPSRPSLSSGDVKMVQALEHEVHQQSGKFGGECQGGRGVVYAYERERVAQSTPGSGVGGCRVSVSIDGGGVSSRGREEGRQLQPASCNKATYVIFKCAGGEGGVDIGGTGARRWEGEGAEGEGGNIARQRHGVNLRWWWVKQQCHGGWDRLLCSLSSMGRGTHPAFALPSLHTHTDIHTCAAVACNPGRA